MAKKRAPQQVASPTPQEMALRELTSAGLDLTETALDTLDAMLRDPQTPPELRARIACTFLSRVAPQLDPTLFQQRVEERRVRALEQSAREATARITRAVIDVDTPFECSDDFAFFADADDDAALERLLNTGDWLPEAGNPEDDLRDDLDDDPGAPV